MNFKVGDKVKFLNSKGGGVIRKILDSRMVSVAVEGIEVLDAPIQKYGVGAIEVRIPHNF